jgi:superfamily II DNA or RNA helicase
MVLSNRDGAVKLDGIRNIAAHVAISTHFHERHKEMSDLVGLFEDDPDEVTRLQQRVAENKARCERFMPAKEGTVDAIVRDRKGYKLLTDEQCGVWYQMLSRDIPKRRFLFEAPAGRGKTVVIAFAAMQFIGRDWPSGTRVLTITHGVNALQYALVKELDEQMSEMTSRGLHIEKIAVSDESECVIYECANKTKSITACTIDYILRTLLDADGTFALRGVRGVFEFDVVLVDEGHHVFNFMDKSHIQGQHELREKERISEEIEKVIKANSLYAIFHDDLVSLH